MKRAAIYFFYDADGVVDRYVEYIIKELHTVSDYLLVVVNGKLQPQGRELFAQIADDFFVRQNDFDAPAYKDGIEYITWEKLMEYDELILSSATFYGPFRPFKDVFSQMDDIKCDYWGISRVYRDDNAKTFLGKKLPWGYKPDYVSSNFHVYRSRLLHSYEFRKHWTTLPEIASYADSAIYHEMAFAVKMENAGFTYETLDRDIPANACPSPTVSGAYEMLSRYNIPFLRRKAIFDPNGSSFDYGPLVPRKALDYISSHTDYDVGMIWENQLRTNTLYDLKNWVGLHRIISADVNACAEKPQISFAVLFYLKDKNRLGECAEYLGSIPSGTHVLLMCGSKELLNEIKSESVFERFDIDAAAVNGKAGEASAIAEGGAVLKAGGYEAVCFITDPAERKAQFNVSDDLYNSQCYENALSSSCYVENVLHVMEKEPYAGMLVSACPTHAEYFNYAGGTWENDDNYRLTHEALKRLGRKVTYAKDKPPTAPYGAAFWFRIAALDPLFDNPADENAEYILNNADSEHLDFFRYLYPLIAQSNGYYSLNISETDNAETELLHMTYQNQAMIQAGIKLANGNPVNFRHLSALLQQRIRQNAAVQQSKRAAAANPGCGSQNQPNNGSKFKRFVRACMPRGLWNLMRRAKCKALGWGYVE